jgi:two-component system chemotaxis response regulator CheY
MSLQVLIVDDSSTARTVIERIVRLTDPGVGACYQASNGREALEVLSHHWVDCIFMDLHMPEMDGRELLSRLRQNELWRTIPVAVITSEQSREIEQELAALGPCALYRKPLTPELVRDIFGKLLEKMP